MYATLGPYIMVMSIDTLILDKLNLQYCLKYRCLENQNYIMIAVYTNGFASGITIISVY